MKDDKALSLFKKMLAKSRNRAIKWEATAEDGTYIASLSPELQLKIWPYTTYDEEGGRPLGPPSVSLNDGRGKLLVDMTYKLEGISTEELIELADLAKRIALKIDSKMDIALKQLEKLAPDDEDIPF